MRSSGIVRGLGVSGVWSYEVCEGSWSCHVMSCVASLWLRPLPDGWQAISLCRLGKPVGSL